MKKIILRSKKVEDRVDGILTFYDSRKKKFKRNSSEKKDREN